MVKWQGVDAISLIHFQYFSEYKYCISDEAINISLNKIKYFYEVW